MKYSKFVLVSLLLAISLPGLAWGPHAEITAAALSVQNPDCPLPVFLGPNFGSLKTLSSMGDLHNRILFEPDKSCYFSNDYLMYPAQPLLSAHTCPGVVNSFGPYFRRAVQALRTETPLNAARWMGALIHFTEDAGAPPHALSGMGALHGPMEKWVKREEIIIAGYRPKLFGKTEDEALAGYLKRMDELIAFSRARAEILKPLAAANDRAACEPIELECALECARVTADLLYTLGEIGPRTESGGCTLRGTINPLHPNEPGVPCAKVILLGTNYSTVADPEGRFEFRNLPPGRYEGRVLKPGYGTGRFAVHLASGEARTANLTLPATVPSGGVLMNGDFSVRWITSERPDGWYPRKDGMESHMMPVQAGRKYRIAADWKQGAAPGITVRWYNAYRPDPATVVSIVEIPAGERELVCVAPETAVAMHMLVRSTEPIETVCEKISAARAR